MTGWLYLHPWSVRWLVTIAYVEAFYLTVLR